MLRQDEFNKSQLVSTGWRFGKLYGSDLIGSQLVMHVIANRVRCGWGSWLSVIEGVPNFMAENNLPPLTFPNVWDGAFVKLLHAVDGIYEGSVSDLSKGALYWADLRFVERPWFKDNILGRQDVHHRVVDMNSLSLFK